MLNKSELHLNSVSIKMLISSLTCFKDLAIENPDRCCEQTENKSKNTFLKLRELRL